MSAAKHTPGPWMVSPEHPTIIRRDYRPISDCGELIGSASGHTKSGFFPSEDEAVANARLIAAAPDLLEALQAIFAAMHPDIPGAPGSAIEKARAAIAKATGSAQ